MSLKPPRIVAETKGVSSEAPLLRLAGKPKVNEANATGYVETRPCFASSWIEPCRRRPDEIVCRYDVAGVVVTVSSPAESSNGLYCVDPPEYSLGPAQLQSLAEAIEATSKSVPVDLDIKSLDSIRPYIKSKAKDHIYSKLAQRADGSSTGEDIEKEAEFLAGILSKYTAGFGILETLLADGLVQDIYVDSPSSKIPVHVVLRSDAPALVRQKCRTNILVGRRDLQGLVSRIKLETGLPFSEANPVLEADMMRLKARVTLTGPPLSDKGVSVAIRKHSDCIWTIPTLVRNNTLSPLVASFLWASVIGRRTVLIAGSRGAGKTTLLGAMLLEFPLSQRIILIEDTPEIALARMQALGYDAQGLRFSSADSSSTVGSAQDALRVSLRMGESAIVIGEVRGEEARVLYESMRAGSAGSSVLGTIHGNSAEGVLDRATEDLRVSPKAFASTDIVVVIGLIRSPEGTRFSRRVTQISEVRYAHGEVQLVDLFATESGCSCAKPTREFSAGSKTISGISAALGTDRETVMDTIRTRAHADQVLSELQVPPGDRYRSMDSFRVESNEVLARCLFGKAGPEAGLAEWRAWLESLKGV